MKIKACPLNGYKKKELIYTMLYNWVGFICRSLLNFLQFVKTTDTVINSHIHL